MNIGRAGNRLTDSGYIVDISIGADMRIYKMWSIVLPLTILGCSSDVSTTVATSKIKEQFLGSGNELGIMVGEVKLRNLPRCVRELKQMKAPEKLIWNVESALRMNTNYQQYAPVKAEFKEVSGVQIVSDNERRARFSYSLVFAPPSKDFKPVTPDDLKLPNECLTESPVLRLLVQSRAMTPMPISAVATFKKFSDGWRMEFFSSDFSGPVGSRPEFLLVPEDQLAAAE